MAILVTGGAGYIGSHTCIELLNAGFEVIIVDNFSNSKPEAIKRIENITGKDISLYEADILNRDDLEIIFSENDIDAVVHFAGLKAVGESVEKPLSYYHNNITGTIIRGDVMREYGVKNIVFSSSATVYGPENESPLTEDMPLGAINPYGQTKLMIEQILKDLSYSDEDWSIALLRYFNPIGAHESGDIGEDPSGIPNNLMPYITQVAVGKREKLYVFGDDYDTHDGTGVRDYIHVVDLAKGHISALEYILDSKGVDAFNLGTGTGYSVLDVIHAFEKASEKKIPYEIVDRRPGDLAICYADPTKASKELGWKAEMGLSEMCKDSWRWQEKNPDGM
ncbi:MAG: UDP-glucose 4-epimerase GalE [Clostridiales bacterium]|nr:UDP-glucose 4-epimerase GalE [Clostridiales bacterium]